MTKNQAIFIAFCRMRLEFSWSRITQAFKQRYIAHQPFNIDRLDDYASGANFGRGLCSDASRVLKINVD